MELTASVRPWEPRIGQGPSVERLRSDFVADASHELKSPVTSILALTAALRTAINDDPEAAKRFAGRLEAEAERLATLASDLLDVTRLERGIAERKSVRFDSLVLAETERLRSEAADLDLRMHVEARVPLPVKGSPSDLAILIHNLIDNAIRHTPEGGTIVVVARRLSGAVELMVQDSGVGIPAGELDHIFERFYRGSSSESARTPGTGLGLAMVRSIAEGHGGTVEARSVVGSGSVFTVKLPLPDEPAQLSRARPALRRVDSPDRDVRPGWWAEAAR